MLEQVAGGWAFRAAREAAEACGRFFDRPVARGLSSAPSRRSPSFLPGPVSRPEIARIHVASRSIRSWRSRRARPHRRGGPRQGRRRRYESTPLFERLGLAGRDEPLPRSRISAAMLPRSAPGSRRWPSRERRSLAADLRLLAAADGVFATGRCRRRFARAALHFWLGSDCLERLLSSPSAPVRDPFANFGRDGAVLRDREEGFRVRSSQARRPPPLRPSRARTRAQGDGAKHETRPPRSWILALGLDPVAPGGQSVQALAVHFMSEM